MSHRESRDGAPALFCQRLERVRLHAEELVSDTLSLQEVSDNLWGVSGRARANNCEESRDMTHPQSGEMPRDAHNPRNPRRQTVTPARFRKP